MPQVRYLASDPTDDQQCTVFGLTFPHGEWVPATKDIADRLDGNPTFDVRADAPRAKAKE